MNSTNSTFEEISASEIVEDEKNHSGDVSSNVELADKPSATDHVEQAGIVSDVVVPDKKVFRASRGLKDVKKAKAETKVVNVDPGSEARTKNERTKVDKSDTKFGERTERRSSIRTDNEKHLNSSPGVIRRACSTIELSTKNETSNFERNVPNRLSETTKPSSIVLQQKMLFDQRINNELKTKYPSSQSLDTRRRSSQLDLSLFEKQERPGSFSSRKPIVRTNSGVDLELTGIVAGARSMFETGGKDKIRPVVRRSLRSEQELQDNKDKRNATAGTIGSTKPLIDAEQPVKTLSDYKESSDTKLSTKKKKFPFKKKKANTDSTAQKYKVAEEKHTKHHDNVELVSARTVESQSHVEEVAIDVTSSMDTLKPEELTEKKKKGIFSRMRMSRKKSTSESSDQERKQSLERQRSNDNELVERKHSSELEVDTPVVEEQNIHQSISDEQHDIPQNTSYSSSEITSLLGTIINRESSFKESKVNANGKTKKKRLIIKKKRRSSSTVDKTIPDVEKPKISVEEGKQKNGNANIDEVKASEDGVPDVSGNNETEPVYERAISPTEVIVTKKLVSDWSFEEEEIISRMQGATIDEIPEEVEEEKVSEDIAANISVNIESTIGVESSMMEKETVTDSVEEGGEDRNGSIEGHMKGNVAELHPTISIEMNENTEAESETRVESIPVESKHDEDDEDDLVSMLDTAEKSVIGSSVRDEDQTSLPGSMSRHDSNGSIPRNDSTGEHDKGEKKKKRFHFHLKGKKKLKSEHLNGSEQSGDRENADKKSKKKRPKSVEVNTDGLGIISSSHSISGDSHDHLDTLTPIDGEEKTKKKKLSLFKKRKKSNSDNVKSNSYSSYNDDTQNISASHNSITNELENGESRHLVSSDEFKIPENVEDHVFRDKDHVTTVDHEITDHENDQSISSISNVSNDSIEIRKYGTDRHREFIKGDDFKEITSPESVEF